MKISKARDVGRLIRQRRRQLGWSQAALAERVQTTRRWIGEIEQGKPTAEVGLVLATLQALGVTLNVDAVPFGGRRAGSRPQRKAQPTAAELAEVLDRHVDGGAPRGGRLSFSRRHRT